MLRIIIKIVKYKKTVLSVSVSAKHLLYDALILLGHLCSNPYERWWPDGIWHCYKQESVVHNESRIYGATAKAIQL